MRSNEDIKKAVMALYEEGVALFLLRCETAAKNKTAELDPEAQKLIGDFRNDGKFENRQGPFEATYQSWYSRVLPLVRQLAPDRLTEFTELYKLDKRKQIDFVTYTIHDFMLGVVVSRGDVRTVNSFAAFSSKFQMQLNILNSLVSRLDFALGNLEGVLQASLFDSELEAADELLKKGHHRAAGALAGVTLEAHLKSVCISRSVKPNKKSAALSDYLEALKNADVIDVPKWRFLQRLADIRNMCVHSRDRNPSSDEIADLITGTRKMVAELS